MLEDLWTSILEFASQFVIPDWGGLIALLPVAIFALVFVVIVLQFWRLARAAPARRGKGRIQPRTPDGIHMPGPSFAPIFAAVGAFLLFLGVVFGGLTLLLGAIALAIGLLYWLRESTALYERDVERTRPELPAVVHDGPPEGVHMPGPSFRPLIAALGAALLLAGLVFGPWLLAAGIIALSIALLGWLRDATGEYRKVEEADETGHLENLPDPRMPSLVLAVFAVLVVGAVLLQTGAFPPGQAVGGEPGASPGRQRSARRWWRGRWRRGRRRWRRAARSVDPGGRRDDHRPGHQIPRVLVRCPGRHAVHDRVRQPRPGDRPQRRDPRGLRHGDRGLYRRGLQRGRLPRSTTSTRSPPARTRSSARCIRR